MGIVIRSSVLLLACTTVVGSWTVSATTTSLPGAATEQRHPVVARFLSGDDAQLTQYRALRRLEGVTRGGKMTALVIAWTELDPQHGFRYEIVHEEGSGQVRGRALRRFLEAEEQAARKGDWRQADFTLKNYAFGEPIAERDGLVRITITPRRADSMLIDGAVFLTPHDGDLVRVEGNLAKRPSFWTRRVDLVRWYGRVAGSRVPLKMESFAQVRVVGASSFTVTWEYESVNGQRVGSPSPDAPGDAAADRFSRATPREPSHPQAR
jgi:hypothetical protein